MRTVVKFMLALPMAGLIFFGGCHQRTTQPTVADPPCRYWTGIGIDGHFDKYGVWHYAWGFVTETGDTMCCYLTREDADSAGAAALLAKRQKDNKRD